MPEIGLLSGSLEEERYGYAPRSRVYAGPDWGWQTEESYQKIKRDEQSPLGVLKGSIRFVSDQYQNLNNFVREITPEPIRNVLDTAADVVSKPLEQGYGYTPMGMAEQGAVQAGEDIGNLLGNPAVGATAGFLLGAVVPGPSELNVVKGALKVRPGRRGNLMPQEHFDILQPERIRGVRDQLDEAKEIVRNIEEANFGVPKKQLKIQNPSYKSALRRLEDLQAKVSSEESNILTPTPDNEFAFPRDTPRAKELKIAATKENEKLGRILSNLDRTLEMHHLFPKGASAAIYNRARDFIEKGEAPPDALRRLAEKLKKATGVDTGDLESNMLPMQTTPHSTFHAEMRYQPSGTFSGQKLEMSKEALATEFRKVKTFKEFEALVDKFIEEDIIPLVQTGKNWQPMDDLIKSISPDYTGTVRHRPKK